MFLRVHLCSSLKSQGTQHVERETLGGHWVAGPFPPGSQETARHPTWQRLDIGLDRPGPVSVDMSDVQNLLCVVVRTLPKAIVIIIVIIYVNLIVPEGLDTPNNMY